MVGERHRHEHGAANPGFPGAVKMTVTMYIFTGL
jgi:hypothetical protein